MLKKFTTILAVSALCLMAATAFAGTMSFPKFKINVPDGWTASQDGDTVILIADNKSASLSITVAGANGMSEKDLAAAFVKELKGSTPKLVDGTYQFTFNTGGVESKATLAVEGKEYYLFVITGENPAIDKMLDSIEDN